MNARTKKFFRRLARIILIVALGWLALTLWAEATGPKRTWELNPLSSGKKALVVFDPDPFYNLDEQVCRAFGQGLSLGDMKVTLATVAALREIDMSEFDLYVVCSNTYNWRPDWAVTGFIKQYAPWKEKPVVAITLGSGTTSGSQQALDALIIKHGGKILDSRSLWLFRPNDESRLDEPNVKVADSLANGWGIEIAGRIKGDIQK